MHGIGHVYPDGNNRILRIVLMQVTVPSTLVLAIVGVPKYGWEAGLPA
jgi:hypothetical protein